MAGLSGTGTSDERQPVPPPCPAAAQEPRNAAHFARPALGPAASLTPQPAQDPARPPLPPPKKGGLPQHHRVL